MPTSEEARVWLENQLADIPADELAHHGILGQKWGIRRDRASAAVHPKRAATFNPRTKAAVKKIAHNPAPKSVKVSKTEDTKLKAGEFVGLGALGIASLAFVTPYSTYAAIPGAVTALPHILKVSSEIKGNAKYIQNVDKAKDFITNVSDTEVLRGASFSRVAAKVETAIDSPKFATYLDHDVLHYRNTWSNLSASSHKPQYVTSMKAVKDVKIASPDSILKVLEDSLHVKLSDGTTLLEKYLSTTGSMRALDAAKPSSAKLIAKHIADSNKYAIWQDELSSASAQVLKKAGYAALTDTWDTGGIAKHAVIVIDNDAFALTSRKLTQGERIASGVLKNRAVKAAVKTAASKL